MARSLRGGVPVAFERNGGAIMAWRPTAEYLADEGRNIFIGPMNGGLWNGRF